MAIFRPGFAALAATGLMLAACASAPVAAPKGDEDIVVRVIELAGFGDTNEVPGFACTLTRGDASWSVVTPATVRVPRSGEALHVVCEKEGYETQRFDRACRTPAERETPHNVERSLIELPLGLLVLPASPTMFVDSLMGFGEHAYTKAQADTCTYGRIELLAVRSR